jgi:hypothetical protein
MGNLFSSSDTSGNKETSVPSSSTVPNSSNVPSSSNVPNSSRIPEMSASIKNSITSTTLPKFETNIPVVNTSDKYSNFENDILKFHNTARQTNGLEPLVWDKALQEKADAWAKFLTQENKGRCTPMRHPGTNGGTQEELNTYIPGMMGQNLYQANGMKIENGIPTPFDPSSPGDAVQKWYDECNLYKTPAPGATKPDNFLGVGHFTQLMWKDTKKVGCGSINCSESIPGKGNSGGKLIVCDYDSGNIGGQFAEKVQSNAKCEKLNTWIQN